MTTTPTMSSDLSPRMLEVLDALTRGLSAAETARELLVDTDTVRAHRGRLYRRLGVHTAHAAVARARALGLIP